MAGTQYKLVDRSGLHDVAEGGAADEQVVARHLNGSVIDTDPSRRVRLRIDVDDKGAMTPQGQRGGEVDRCRGLGHAALLVGHADDPAPTGGDRSHFQ